MLQQKTNGENDSGVQVDQAVETKFEQIRSLALQSGGLVRWSSVEFGKTLRPF